MYKTSKHFKDSWPTLVSVFGTLRPGMALYPRLGRIFRTYAILVAVTQAQTDWLECNAPLTTA